MKRTFMEIMTEMDDLEEMVISDELIDILKDHFKEEIDTNQKKNPNSQCISQG